MSTGARAAHRPPRRKGLSGGAPGQMWTWLMTGLPHWAAARYDLAMAAQSPIRRMVTIARLWRPQTYWQVWLSAAALPLVASNVEVVIRLISGRWPQFDTGGAIATFIYVATRVGAGSRALRTRCKILGLDRG